MKTYHSKCTKCGKEFITSALHDAHFNAPQCTESKLADAERIAERLASAVRESVNCRGTICHSCFDALSQALADHAKFVKEQAK